MATHHQGHTHQHGPACGHVGILHEGHQIVLNLLLAI